MKSFYQEMVAAVERRQRFALALISRVKGSSPQKNGAKALFLADGRIVGTLGGGCLEAEVHRRALKSLRTGQPMTFEMTLDHDFGWDDGLICGGTVFGLILPQAAGAEAVWRGLACVPEARIWGVDAAFDIRWGTPGDDPSGWLYRETVAPPFRLWIAGSGHVAQAVARLAVDLDFEVTVFDDRPELANHRHFPRTVHLRVGNWGEVLRDAVKRRPTMGLIVTRGHQHDALVLAEWIHQPFAHLGMIGSRRKARLIRKRFLDEKRASAAQLERVSCPVGLDIDAQSVEEIAVSILAEYIRARAHSPASTAGTAAGAGPALEARTSARE